MGDKRQDLSFYCGIMKFEGHRPYFRLLLEGSWYASPEFPPPFYAVVNKSL